MKKLIGELSASSQHGEFYDTLNKTVTTSSF